MLKILFVGIFFEVFFVSCQYQNEIETTRIIFVGDLLLDRGVRDKIDHRGVDALFHSSIDSAFRTADIVVANLECPATTIEEPINKKYIFRAEPEWLNALKKHGISHLNIANNHSMDQGRNGLEDTSEEIRKSGLMVLGYGKNAKEACKPQLIATEPRNIYVLSSLQVPSENWTYLEDKPCVCEESVNSIAVQISKLRKTEPDAVIIIQLHWGIEHQSVPITSQKQQAYQLINSGADCIIGHHTHTVQTIEYYNKKPIFYSIGNFIFDQSNEPNTEGIMVKLNISGSIIKIDTIQFEIEKCTPIMKWFI